MVAGVVLDLLTSASKFSDAGYFTIFNKEEVNIYNAATTNVTTSKPPILKWWCDSVSTLWLILLVKRSPGPNVGQVTSRVPGARATSWDPKNPYSPFLPSPQNNPKCLPAEDEAGGRAIPARSGRISDGGDMTVRCDCG